MTGKRVLGWLTVTTVVACVFVGAVATAVDEGGPDKKPSCEDTAAPGEQDGGVPVLDANLSEILRIRRELGGDLYRGTVFERLGPIAGGAGDGDGPSGDSAQAEPDEEFAAALRTAAAEAEVQPRVPDRVLDNLAWQDEGVRRADLVDDLRRAARGLDAQAAEFEDRELSGEADRLWKLARRLRTTARQLRGGEVLPSTP